MKEKEVDRKFRLARIWSNRELRKVAPLFTGKIANVSAGTNVDKEGDTYDNYFTNKEEFWLTNYEPGSYRGFQGKENELLVDLTKELPKELAERFDVVFNHTTLEHIFDVFTAFANLCKLTKDVVIVVVPFAQEQHENTGYLDYWRFTPTCLRKLFEINQMEVLYESANQDANAATYLFFVGSKQAEKWKDKLPDYTVVNNAADWIGRTDTRGMLAKLINPGNKEQ